jgi:hypothetical protein
MKRRTAVRQSSLYSAPLFIALFSILLPCRLVALDLDLVRMGGYDTSGLAWGGAESGTYAYVAAGGGLQVIDMSSPSNSQRVGGYWRKLTSALSRSGSITHVSKTRSQLRQTLTKAAPGNLSTKVGIVVLVKAGRRYC